MFKKVLAGFDGSDGSHLALVKAVELAKELNAEVWALWVKSTLPHYPETVDEVDEEKTAADAFKQKLAREITKVSKEYVHEIHSIARTGHPAKTIVEYADEGHFDLIVLGNRGHSGLWGRFLGHTTDKVSENANCSVLIVRQPT